MVTSKKGCKCELKKKKIDGNKDVDPQLWHAVAGGMVQIPELNSNIFYFPQGHAEHAYQPVHFPADFKIPSGIPCRVAAIHYRADPDTDEVYARLRLVPLNNSEVVDDGAVAGVDDMSVTKNKYESYTKTLTHSDANTGGFSCPRYCAETLFPPLDYSGTPPSQDIYPTDIHGEMWELKHFYRGSPKRHVLTIGWADFVTNKLLVPGDSLVFLRAENGDLHIGIRRCKRQNDVGFNPSSKSKTGIRRVPSHGELTTSSRKKDDKPRKNDKGNELRISDKVKAEDVIEAVKLAVNMQPFDVVYYPRVGTPEFFVKTSLINTTLQTQWYVGMRFKMAIESENSSRIIWYYGTIASFLAADPAWPDSLWRLLQVTWDEPNLLTNTKRLNPWQVDISQYVPPPVHFSPFLPSSKELGLPQLPNFPMDSQFSMPCFPNNFQTPNVPIFPLPETSAAHMQGAMHDYFSPFTPYFHQPFNHNDATASTMVPNNLALQKASTSENVSCSRQPSEILDHAKPEEFVPFVQTIQSDSGNENAENKITNYSSDPLQDLLQDLLEGSFDERLECNPENQREIDASAGETVEIEDSVKK